MDSIDPQLQHRVWQRIQGAPAYRDPPDQWLVMIAGAWTAAAAYLRLSRHFRGSDAALLRRMHREEMASFACLKGLYTLATGQQPLVKAAPLPREGQETALRRCCRMAQQTRELYRQQMDHPEFGPVFATLHSRVHTHCVQLLELIGRLSQNKAHPRQDSRSHKP